MKYLGSPPVLPFGAVVVIMSDQIFSFFEEAFINKFVLCGPDMRCLKWKRNLSFFRFRFSKFRIPKELTSLSPGHLTTWLNDA